MATYLLLVPAAFAFWCGAAFLLRWRGAGRLLATTLVPAAIAASLYFIHFWTHRAPATEAGWSIVFGLVSLLVGAASLLATLPVYYLTERWLGGRAA